MKLWTKDVAFGSTGQTKLTNTFLILEATIGHRIMESQVATTKGEKDALRTLLKKGYIERQLFPSVKSKRLVYYYTATQKGIKEYYKMREKYYKDVKPEFIN